MRSLHTKTGGQPPLAATRESLYAAMNTQHSQKQIKVKKKKKKNSSSCDERKGLWNPQLHHQVAVGHIPDSEPHSHLYMGLAGLL